MTIAKNDNTSKFERDDRFLIDDPDSGDKLAYLLTKPLKVGKTYEGFGVYSFVLQEVVSTKDDNMEKSIADYYKHFPRECSRDSDDGVPEYDGNEININSRDGYECDPPKKKVWL